jgi:MoxR-like ATPase
VRGNLICAAEEGARVPVADDELQWFGQRFGAVTDNIERVIQGKRDTIELLVICLLAGGHTLIEDVPGVGKTLLAKSLARSIDCTFQRIQFTPDLLPSDVTGVSVWDRDTSKFVFRPGPVFANVLLGDEINRASPKTQSAMLEAMEERQVTVDAVTRVLSPPFIVIATQNPIEHEGTYPLPEAQLDRFMMRLTIGYPSRDKELEMLDTHGDHSTYEDLQPVVRAEDIVRMADIARRIHVSDAIKGYLVDLADHSRHDPDLMLGASPRATLYLQRASRAHAVAQGRDFVSPDDVKAMLGPVLNHRLILRPEAQMRGVTMDDVVAGLGSGVMVPGTKAAV